MASTGRGLLSCVLIDKLKPTRAGSSIMHQKTVISARHKRAADYTLLNLLFRVISLHKGPEVA